MKPVQTIARAPRSLRATSPRNAAPAGVSAAASGSKAPGSVITRWRLASSVTRTRSHDPSAVARRRGDRDGDGHAAERARQCRAPRAPSLTTTVAGAACRRRRAAEPPPSALPPAPSRPPRSRAVPRRRARSAAAASRRRRRRPTRRHRRLLCLCLCRLSRCRRRRRSPSSAAVSSFSSASVSGRARASAWSPAAASRFLGAGAGSLLGCGSGSGSLLAGSVPLPLKPGADRPAGAVGDLDSRRRRARRLRAERDRDRAALARVERRAGAVVAGHREGRRADRHRAQPAASPRRCRSSPL